MVGKLKQEKLIEMISTVSFHLDVLNAFRKEFRTGQAAPLSGVYKSEEHIDSTQCSATPAERWIYLDEGNTFPPHRSCSSGAIWKLVYII